MRVHACGGQRSTVGVIPQKSTLVFLRQGLSLALVLVKQTRLSGQGAPAGLPCPYPAMLGSPVHRITLAISRDCGDWIQDPMLTQQALHRLSVNIRISKR